MAQFEVVNSGDLHIGRSNSEYSVPLSLSTRYQPIVGLASGTTIGFELLSKVESIKNIDPEFFFRNIQREDLINIVVKQIEKLNDMYERQYSCLDLFYFINISISLLSSSDFIFWVCQNAKFKLAFEIDIVDISLYEGGLPKTNVNLLLEHGHEIWLDDYKGDEPTKLVAGIPWSGIKIDKSYLWRNVTDYEELSSILSLSLLRGRKTIIEGIETANQKKACLQAGFMFGQGFYWNDL